ncbi:hypothetical protein LZD49_12555 [Dyadobacter sp. CY261]|uniref:hypothetical protein n=1 Tax=Dyadobacter sp. CY261 TaxID=2907203 RepID=UPI001F298F33|nr:hypothetical protein [Dyadobacter sp. CY261]MCF0071304.1 hypothetical protein [Dyadobacter sp. CY261]
MITTLKISFARNADTKEPGLGPAQIGVRTDGTTIAKKISHFQGRICIRVRNVKEQESNDGARPVEPTFPAGTIW